MHGKTCPVVHDGDELFQGIPSPVTGMRYHSLVVDPASLPQDLAVTALGAVTGRKGRAARSWP